MSKRDKRRNRGSAVDRVTSNTQDAADELFEAPKQTSADIWGEVDDGVTSDGVEDGIYGSPRPSASQLESKLHHVEAQLESAIVPSGKDLEWNGWRLTPTGLQAPDEISDTDYEQIGRLLLDLKGRIQWLLGDWIAFGEDRQWGETYKQLAEEFGYEVKTLWEYASVCRQVDSSIRMEELTFGHHQIVRAMDADAQAQWLQRAAAGENGKPWSIKRLREEIKASAPDPKLADGTATPVLSREQARAVKRILKGAATFSVDDLKRLSSKDREKYRDDLTSLEKLVETLRRALK